jgi:hypothetical protein
LAIDRIDRTVVPWELPAGGGLGPEPVERQHHVVLGVVSLTRTAVMVVLASLAILVLLPAAIAAQAASI